MFKFNIFLYFLKIEVFKVSTNNGGFCFCKLVIVKRGKFENHKESVIGSHFSLCKKFKATLFTDKTLRPDH